MHQYTGVVQCASAPVLCNDAPVRGKKFSVPKSAPVQCTGAVQWCTGARKEINISAKFSVPKSAPVRCSALVHRCTETKFNVPKSALVHECMESSNSVHF